MNLSSASIVLHACLIQLCLSLFTASECAQYNLVISPLLDTAKASFDCLVVAPVLMFEHLKVGSKSLTSHSAACAINCFLHGILHFLLSCNWSALKGTLHISGKHRSITEAFARTRVIAK